MRLMAKIALAALIAAATTTAAQAFQTVRDEAVFLDLVEDKDLTRFGIRVQVKPSGEIRGRAFGRSVTGNWRWRDGYFCRSLYYGDRDLGPNCQEVKIDGNTIRFTSDRGDGIYADLELR